MLGDIWKSNSWATFAYTWIQKMSHAADPMGDFERVRFCIPSDCDCCWWWIRGGWRSLVLLRRARQTCCFQLHVDLATLVTFKLWRRNDGFVRRTSDGSPPGPFERWLGGRLKNEEEDLSGTKVASNKCMGSSGGFWWNISQWKVFDNRGVTSEDRVFWDPVTAPFTWCMGKTV